MGHYLYLRSSRQESRSWSRNNRLEKKKKKLEAQLSNHKHRIRETTTLGCGETVGTPCVLNFATTGSSPNILKSFYRFWRQVVGGSLKNVTWPFVCFRMGGFAGKWSKVIGSDLKWAKLFFGLNWVKWLPSPLIVPNGSIG